MAKRLPFLLNHVSVELLIRTMLTEDWAPQAWPTVKYELAKALRMWRQLARDGVELNDW